MPVETPLPATSAAVSSAENCNCSIGQIAANMPALLRAHRALYTLRACHEQLVRAADEASLLNNMVAMLVRHGGYRLAWVGLAEKDGERSVRPVAQAGFDDGYLDEVRISWADNPLGHGPTGTAIREQRTVVARFILSDPAYAPWRSNALRRGYASSIAMPLMVDDSCLGALNVYASEEDAFDAEEVELLTGLARDIAYGMRSLRDHAARQQAEAASHAKTSFLANMSHEIRSPMSAILGLAHLLQRSELQLEQRLRVDKIVVSAQHLLSVINDILDLSKIEAGRFEFEHTDFELCQIILDVTTIMGEAARAKGLALGSDCPLTGLWLRGDPTRLRQALLNYVSNAIKFTSQGRVVLAVEQLADPGPGCLLRFSVRDTGQGIAPEILPRLFSHFEQGDTSTCRLFGGTGLGLAITRHLAERMGGVVGAHSTPGIGSEFWLTVRLAYGDPQAASAVSAGAGPDLLRLRQALAGQAVLVVDDNTINLEVARDLLVDAGLEVTCAESGDAALELARQHSFALVLMDLQMPVMDGVQATRLLRGIAGYSHTPIIAMTASTFAEDRAACLAAGMDDFLAKPVEPAVLYATVTKWLPGVLPIQGGGAVPSLMASGNLDVPQSRLADVGPAEPPSVLATALAMLPGVDLPRGLRTVAGREERYLQLLSRCVQTYQPQIVAWQGMDVVLQASELQAGLHRFRGVAATLGLDDLSCRLAELESVVTALAAETADRAAEWQEGMDWVARFMTALASTLPRLTAAPPS